MKKILAVMIALLVALAFTVPSGYADMGGKCMMMGKKDGGHMDLEEKFHKKVMMVYKNQQELGLSQEQLDAIKALKIQTKKNLIKLQAEIDLVMVDLKSAMWEDEIDMDAVDALITKKYDTKKQKAKTTISAIAQLGKILTAEQKTKLKSLCMR